jgi:hypothetical protein
LQDEVVAIALVGFPLQCHHAPDHDGNLPEGVDEFDVKVYRQSGDLAVVREARNHCEAVDKQDAQELDLRGDIVFGDGFEPAAFGGCEKLLKDVVTGCAFWTPIGQVVEDGFGSFIDQLARQFTFSEGSEEVHDFAPWLYASTSRKTTCTFGHTVEVGGGRARTYHFVRLQKDCASRMLTRLIII